MDCDLTPLIFKGFTIPARFQGQEPEPTEAPEPELLGTSAAEPEDEPAPSTGVSEWSAVGEVQLLRWEELAT